MLLLRSGNTLLRRLRRRWPASSSPSRCWSRSRSTFATRASSRTTISRTTRCRSSRSPTRAPEPEASRVRVAAACRSRAARLIACIVLVALAAIGVVTIHSRRSTTPIDYRITKEDAKRIAAAALGRAARRRHAHASPRPWKASAPGTPTRTREDGGAPGGFDTVAADYILRNGLPMPSLLDVMRTKIPAATWMVRAFAPQRERGVLRRSRSARVARHRLSQVSGREASRRRGSSSRRRWRSRRRAFAQVRRRRCARSS